MEKRIYEREKLYKEVWEEPMTSLAKKYGVSDVALRKHCLKMDIPLPKAGHWVKVKAGHKVEIPSLPKSEVPDKVIVTAQSDNYHGRKIEDLLLFLPEEQRQYVIQYCFSLSIPDKLTNPHGLIKDTKQYYRPKKETTKPPMDRVINMNVSDEHKERVYRFYNTLIKALEHLGYTVEIKVPKYHGYYRRNELFICLNEDSVPVFIKEKQKRIEYTPTKEELSSRNSFRPSSDYVKTGKLHFGIDSYHAKRKNWHDTETKKNEEQIGEIIMWVMEAIQVEKTIREKREAEKDRRLEEESIRQQLAKRKEEELKQLELLNQYVIDWDKADKIRKFADVVELKLIGIDKEEEREKLINWLKWARDKADWIDPLMEKEDDLLGENISLIEKIMKK